MTSNKQIVAKAREVGSEVAARAMTQGVSHARAVEAAAETRLAADFLISAMKHLEAGRTAEFLASVANAGDMASYASRALYGSEKRKAD